MPTPVHPGWESAGFRGGRGFCPAPSQNPIWSYGTRVKRAWPQASQIAPEPTNTSRTIAERLDALPVATSSLRHDAQCHGVRDRSKSDFFAGRLRRQIEFSDYLPTTAYTGRATAWTPTVPRVSPSTC